jgi:spore maturation protein CgeB
VCNNFHICSTPEKKFVEEYKKLQYDNIIYATWHANSDFYSNLRTKRDNLISFVGAPRGDRVTFLRALEEGGISVTHPMNASFEDLIFAYSNSQMGINFSKNSNNNKTQMKARMFEIPAAGSLLVTEYHENLSECYEIDKEIVTFGNSVEMVEKINFLSKNPKIVDNIRDRGHKRFLKEHDSKIRLNLVLNRIKEL